MTTTDDTSPSPHQILAAADPQVRRGERDGTRGGAGVTAFGSPVERIESHLREPAPDEVTIDLVAAGAGLWDAAEAMGAIPLQAPRLLGWQGAGTVSSAGSDVAGLAIGDHVVAYQPLAGFYADRVTVPAACVVRAPASIDLVDAAALLIGASTAYQGLVRCGQLRAGQSVLITAAAGGTGTYAVELARHLGARVLATAGPDNASFVRDLGADEVFDYHDDPLGRIKQACPDGVDVLLDNVSADNFTLYAPLVTEGGVAVGTNEPQPPPPRGRAGHLVTSWDAPDVFAEVVRLVDDGVLNVRVGQRFALTDAGAAHAHLLTRHGRGAVVVTTR